MDLIDRDQPRVRQHRSDCTAAVLINSRRIVAGAGADVQPGHDSGRDTTSTAEKAVRYRQQPGSDDFDRHSASRMIRSRSICLPIGNS